ncbi:MAG: serine/threonine-protein kinase [bacterium]
MKIEHGDKKYRVLRELGRGHSGTVYLALDPRNREVAIKCLASQTNEAMLQRFRREFAILRSLQHPNIAQPVDFGYDEELQRHFFVAEYVAGTSLDVALHTAAEEEAARLLAQALRALDYMHRQGVFHCDLKPGNILVTLQGQLKIIDFDVAVRGTEAIGGTPSYCAPELLTGEAARPDAKSDLFSLGATFYHCLTREKPFQARNFSELVVAHAHQRPKLPSQINPHLGTLWDGLLMGLLQIQPSQRYATASAALQQLYPLLCEKKIAFSPEDIAYRLRQHGAPIGKESLLSQIQYFLDQNPAAEVAQHLVLVRGAPGLGATYLAAELRAMAQLRGIPCFVSDARETSLPTRFPFLWILDQCSRQARAHGTEFAAWLKAKVEELAYKANGAAWWLVILGLEPETPLPEELRALFAAPGLQLELRPWSPLESKSWLEEIFQTEEIPPFLASRVQEECGGNPRRSSSLLQTALRRGLLLDRAGQWRRDLHQPSELFRGEFVAEPAGEELSVLFAGANEEERELLSALALSYSPLPGAFFERWLGRESVHASLRHLVALGAVQGGGDRPYRLATEAWKDFLLGRWEAEARSRRHDQWRVLADSPALADFFSEEARLYHRAQGSDPLLAAEAWAAFGDRKARGDSGRAPRNATARPWRSPRSPNATCASAAPSTGVAAWCRAAGLRKPRPTSRSC